MIAWIATLLTLFVSIGAPTSAPTPDMVVVLPDPPPDKCKCNYVQTIAWTVASGTCSDGGQNYNCFSYSSTDPAGSTASSPGRCYVVEQCIPAGAAQPCHFRGFDVHVTAATCAASCSDWANTCFTINYPSGSGYANGVLCAGQEFKLGNPPNQTGIVVTQPDMNCGTPNTTKTITIFDQGTTKGVITVTFGCGNCQAAVPPPG